MGHRVFLRGAVSVDATLCVITRGDLDYMVQTLTIDRTEPAEEDRAPLESLKSTVKRFPWTHLRQERGNHDRNVHREHSGPG